MRFQTKNNNLPATSINRIYTMADVWHLL